jgi:cytochrome o ubiquinol oxidase subunit 1
MPIILGAAAFVCAFGLVWHIGWAAAGGMLAGWVAVIARSFVRETHHVISAEALRQAYARHLQQAQQTVAVSRDQEHSPLNHGLAQVQP